MAGIHGKSYSLKIVSAAVAASFSATFTVSLHAQQSAGEQQLPEVQVISVQDAQKQRKDSEIQKIVIQDEEIERYADATVGDVLRRLPGMTFTGPPGVVKDIRMRGLDKGYTNFLIDGEPIATGKKERQIQVDRLPADMIERIEIIRSPSAEYDSNGIGGTINIVLKEGAKADVTRLRGSYGKNGSLDVGDAIVQVLRKYESLDVSLVASYTVGAEDVGEVKDKFNAAGAFTEREVKDRPVKKTELLVAPRFKWRFGRDADLVLEPTLSRGTEKKTEPSVFTNAAGAPIKRAEKIEDKTDEVSRLGARFTRRMSEDWSWTLKAGIERGEEDKGTPVTREFNAAGALTKTTLAPEITREDRQYGGANTSVRVGPRHLVKTGVEIARIDYDNIKRTIENGVDKTAGKDNFRVTEDKFTLFAQDEWRVADRHWLTPGFRFERISRTSTDSTGAMRDGESDALNPSLHYRWAVRPNTNIRASVSRTVRLPRFDDLNPLVAVATGTNSSTNPDKGGNAGLEPEKALGWEFGVEWFLARDAGVIGVNLFNRDIEDFVQRVTALEGARFVERAQNVGTAQFRGAELDWRVPFKLGSGKLTASGNLSILEGRVKSVQTGSVGDVKDLPPYVANLGVDYASGPWAWGMNASYQPGFTTDSVNPDRGLRESKIKNRQTLLDLYVLRHLGRGAVLRLVGKNLLRINKLEDTTKFKSDGTVDNREFRSETSKPTLYLTFEYRY